MRTALLVIFAVSFLHTGICSADGNPTKSAGYNPTRVVSRGYIPIRKELLAGIHSVKAHNVVIQDEIIATPDMFTFGGSGKIKRAQRQLQEKILPLYDATDDFDFRAYAGKRMSEFFKNRYAVKANHALVTPRIISEREEKALLAASKKGEAHVFTNTFYRIRQDLSTIEIFTFIVFAINPKYANEEYIPDDEQGTEEEIKTHVYHQNAYIFQSRPVKSIEKWTANNGALYIQTLKQGVDEILRMIEIDFRRPERNSRKLAPKGSPIFAWFRNLLGFKYLNKGFVLHRSPERVILRNSFTGSVSSVHSSQANKQLPEELW